MKSVDISITDLTVGYSAASRVLQGLSLEVPGGQIIGLVGASGCGKSTLLRATAGLLPPAAGAIRFSGETPQQQVGDLAFVFQDPTLLAWRTVLQNVLLPLELGKRLEDDQEGSDAPLERAQAALESVGLSPEHHAKFPRALSGGMRMRTSIARALVTDPHVLLLDEPFAALDDLLRSRLNELLLQLWQARRRTILFVTHNIAEAAFLSHRVAIFGRGTIATVLENPLPWPRPRDVRTTVEFAQFYGEISRGLAEAAT